MKPLLLASGAEPLAQTLCAALGAEQGSLVLRHFPDGESYVRLASAVEGRDIIFLWPLDGPDARTIPATAARAASA